MKCGGKGRGKASFQVAESGSKIDLIPRFQKNMNLDTTKFNKSMLLRNQHNSANRECKQRHERRLLFVLNSI